MGFGSVGVKEFIKLDDTPASYAGEAGKVAAVKAAEDALEFILAGVPNFLALADTPASYVGQGGKVAAVKAAENALEFILAGASNFRALTDTPASYVGNGGNVVVVKVAEDGLEFISEAPTAGFGDKWLKHDPSGQLAASLHWRFDEVSFGVNGVGIDCRLYTEPMRAWGFRRPVACEIRRARGADAAGNPYVYSAIVGVTADIRNNMSQPCVGFMTGTDGQVSCFNGDGAGFKKTDFAWGIEPPLWLKWVISDTDIKFYGNNTLIATHTTYRPINVRDLFFAHQAYGASNYPRLVYLTRPHYSAD